MTHSECLEQELRYFPRLVEGMFQTHVFHIFRRKNVFIIFQKTLFSKFLLLYDDENKQFLHSLPGQVSVHSLGWSGKFLGEEMFFLGKLQFMVWGSQGSLGSRVSWGHRWIFLLKQEESFLLYFFFLCAVIFKSWCFVQNYCSGIFMRNTVMRCAKIRHGSNDMY